VEVVDQTGVGFVFRVVNDMRLTTSSKDWRRIPAALDYTQPMV
jgi:hypothetical protein